MTLSSNIQRAEIVIQHQRNRRSFDPVPIMRTRNSTSNDHIDYWDMVSSQINGDVVQCTWCFLWKHHPHIDQECAQCYPQRGLGVTRSRFKAICTKHSVVHRTLTLMYCTRDKCAGSALYVDLRGSWKDYRLVTILANILNDSRSSGKSSINGMETTSNIMGRRAEVKH